MDQQLKDLMKALGAAINESLSDSKLVAEVVSRIKEGGCDIFLVLEATIGVSKQGQKTRDKTSFVTSLSRWADKDSVVTALSKSSSESVRVNLQIGDHVRVGPMKPDGTPHPSAGQTGRIRDLLRPDAKPLRPQSSSGQVHAVIEVDNGFIVVSVQCLEVLQ